MSENPFLVLRELDEAFRAAQRETAKLRTEVLALARQAKNPDRATLQMVRRLDRLNGLLEPAALTQRRQVEAGHKPEPEPTRAPDDLRCKLCGEEKNAPDFFFDDGHGRYGFTGRCADCRSKSKRERHQIATARGLVPQQRRKAVGRAVGQ
jgi:hypothetical protein